MPSNVQTVWVSSPCFREVNIKRGSCVIPDSAGHLILVQNDKAKTPKTCFNIGKKTFLRWMKNFLKFGKETFQNLHDWSVFFFFSNSLVWTLCLISR